MKLGWAGIFWLHNSSAIDRGEGIKVNPGSRSLFKLSQLKGVGLWHVEHHPRRLLYRCNAQLSLHFSTTSPKLILVKTNKTHPVWRLWERGPNCHFVISCGVHLALWARLAKISQVIFFFYLFSFFFLNLLLILTHFFFWITDLSWWEKF